MTITLDRGGEIGQSGLGRSGGCSPIYGAGEIAGVERKLRPATAGEVESDVSTCSSSSSSIGKNSESVESEGEGSAGEKEVESAYKGPMSALESLEKALPIRRGISNFYDGKSKSFASLSDAMVSCSKELGKQENAYTRKRRNLLASKNFSLKSSSSTSSLLRSNGGGISKRPLSSSGRSMLSLAAAATMNAEQGQQQQRFLLPPLPPSGKSAAADSSTVGSLLPEYCMFSSRSFSMMDLQGIVGSGPSAEGSE